MVIPWQAGELTPEKHDAVLATSGCECDGGCERKGSSLRPEVAKEMAMAGKPKRRFDRHQASGNAQNICCAVHSHYTEGSK
ncbi:hypothetical protein CY34DRAFT_286484 [Suillus luteus UH-Slu-Lm8-n1]|uniref:Uncharacterized protein n=1 Tax=Suillus luteus UH-Slu-Lm8-n1 TaxID=930992 RepID=A0A0C9ZQV0_9AGAM|nr:hypothetical protein CY34DRAFT_286484 [Suillus luteus UH-Slu-Lm8-n1]